MQLGTSKTTISREAPRKPPAKKREWSPRFWTGMSLPAWWRLLRRHQFDVEWRFWPHALIITLMSVFNTAYRAWQWPWMGRKAARTKIELDPIFIIGHWRAGTTLLHELMVLDERHTSPTTYECLVPNHFLLSEDFSRRWLNFLLPSQRPMDNMPTGWDRPQEDEFAMCNLGAHSPYLTIAFPNHRPQDTEYLTLEHVSDHERDRWKQMLWRFLQEITYRTPKRIVLKSPPHTCRIRLLLDLFPEARFVHIVRDPFVVFPSTVNLWKTLYRRHGLQTPRFDGIEEYVFDTFERMYRRFEEERALIPSDRFCEVHYEGLVRDPVGLVRHIYAQIGLDDFDRVLPALETYVAASEGYQTNRYELSPELRQQIARRWAGFIQQYGYGAAAEAEVCATGAPETGRSLH